MMDVRILDGGLATQLESEGFAINDDPLWSARLLHTQPMAIQQVHSSYLECGADIIETATYQASIEGLSQHTGLSADQCTELIKSAVQLAQNAVEQFWDQQQDKQGMHKPQVAGSIGPYGACQHDASEYHGNYVDSMSIQELKNWHRPRLKTLINAGVDLLAVETIPAQKEALAITELLREFPSSKAFLTFSCKDEQHTCHGEKFAEAVSSVVSHGHQLVAVGVNCCSPRFIAPLLRQAKDCLTQTPFVVYPNSGEQWVNSGWSGKGNMSELSSLVPEWISLGARIIGGCCRTTPEDVRTISQVVKTSTTNS